MRYVSTRGGAPDLDFGEVVLAGLASDGGLYMPERWPTLGEAALRGLRGAGWVEVATEVMAPFAEPTLSRAELEELVRRAASRFRHPEVAPLRPLTPSLHVLELFHGPTLAFKDVALQLLGPLFDTLLARRGERLTIVGATSGDTGSAAIEGCRGRDAVDVFILHPHDRTSEVQRRQMTTVLDDNVHNLAVEGTFDDCQDIVKALFRDPAAREALRLGAVNSINWARVLAQVVYYVTAALALGAPDRAVSFCVPTGNFGDVLAGWCARRMGVPIRRLIIATNRNDILARTLATGVYAKEGVAPSLSPSMDIEVSSNFERLLWELHDRDPAVIRRLMAELAEEGRFALSTRALDRLRAGFAAHGVDDATTLACIERTWREHGYLVDPHTAVGLEAARAVGPVGDEPLVVLATAHPAKFPDAVEQATGVRPPLPDHLADLYERPERYDVVPPTVEAVEAILRARSRVARG